jgi:hypothetical protein
MSAASSASARQARVSVPVALGLTVFAVSVVHVVLALRIPSPWAFPDELRYAELAKSLGDGSLPSIRDRVTFDYGLGYPLLLAPIWAVFEDVTTAYWLAKVLNSVVFALTAVPAYLLARRFLAETHALVAAALCVSIPSLLLGGMLMTEVALYPTFVLALLAITVALERPTPATQLAALGAIALASAVKLISLTLLIAVVVAVPLFHWLDTRNGRTWRLRLRPYVPTGIGLAAAAVVGAGLALASGRAPKSALGSYDWVLDNADLTAIPLWMFRHLAEFDLFLAVIPFAATCLVVTRGLRRTADTRTRLLSTLILTVSVPWFAAVATYSSNTGQDLYSYGTGAGAHERSTFVLAPLFLIALIVWLDDRRSSLSAVAVAAFVAAALPSAIPLDLFEENEVSLHAFALVPWVGAREYVHWPIGVLVLTTTLGALFVWLARTRASNVAFLAPVVATFVLVTLIAQTVIEVSSEQARSAGYGDSPRWVHRAAGGSDVSVLWFEGRQGPSTREAARHRVVWVNEFFNRSIGTVYQLGSPQPFLPDLAATPVRLSEGRVVLEDGRPAAIGPLVLAPCHVRVDGDVVARDSRTGAVVYRVREPVHATTRVPGSC